MSCHRKSEKARNLIFHEGTLIQLKGITNRCAVWHWLVQQPRLVHRIIISHPVDSLAACSGGAQCRTVMNGAREKCPS